nr:fibronectin type III domain-containing protein [Candidatus Shapirobacteria bacterium]
MKLLKIKSPVWLFLLSLAFLSPLLAGKIWAADLNIDCSDESCEPAAAEPLFNSDPDKDGYWYPGRSLTKTINLKNSSSQRREMAIKGERTADSILERVMHISITGGGLTLWSGSLGDFYGMERISLGVFNPGTNFDYNLTASMDINADNNYQNQKTAFNLVLGFWGEPVSPTATPTPTPTTTKTTTTKTTTTKTTTTTTGAVLGAGVSAPVCSDAKPGLPTNFTAVAGPGAGQVTLTWTPPTLPHTYFLIAYSDTADTLKWGNPNISASATSYIVSGLGGGSYWFWLKAGN